MAMNRPVPVGRRASEVSECRAAARPPVRRPGAHLLVGAPPEQARRVASRPAVAVAEAILPEALPREAPVVAAAALTG
jgi:hypothetical protein